MITSGSFRSFECVSILLPENPAGFLFAAVRESEYEIWTDTLNRKFAEMDGDERIFQ